VTTRAEEEVIDATVVSEEDKHERELSQALVPHNAVALSVTPQIKADELVERLAVIRDAMENSMVEGVDYGVIPGTAKPTLLKPGAEKLGVLFQLDVQIVNEQAPGPGDHLTVTSKATAYHAPTGTRVGYGEGLCTTRERKYAYRNQQRTCPTCNVAAIIKGKAEYGGGWVCFKKKGGCGAKFADGAAEIESQTVGEIDNPDLPDLWNTAIKMGEKRARVDVILAVTGASALFTQDAEDLPGAETPATTEPVEQGPPYGPEVDNAQLVLARKAIGYLLHVEPGDQQVTEACRWLATDAGGYLPSCTVRGITHVAKKRARDANPEEQPPDDRTRAAEVLAAEHDRIAAEEFGESVEATT
jgi:hypothetical protein